MKRCGGACSAGLSQLAQDKQYCPAARVRVHCPEVARAQITSSSLPLLLVACRQNTSRCYIVNSEELFSIKFFKSKNKMIDQNKTDGNKFANIAVAKEGYDGKTDNFSLCQKRFVVKTFHRSPDLHASRGSAILKAALNDRCRKENKAPSMAQFEPPKFNQITNRKRSSKNSVIFREPIVSHEYSYEQTPVYESIADDNSCTPNLETKDDSRVNSTEMPVDTLPKRKRLSSSLEDDNDEDLFVLDSPNVVGSEYGLKKVRSKRPHDSVDDSKIDVESKKKLATNSGETTGLFSAPKVARIAPYFAEKNDVVVEETKSQLGYLGWFSNFFSAQMNKLIF